MLIKETVENANDIRTIADMFNSLIELSDRTLSEHDEFLRESAKMFLDWVNDEVDMMIGDPEDE